MRQVSDPAPISTRQRRGGVISGPIIVIILCAIAGLPPVASHLTSFDSTIHTHNDAIVSWLLVAMPFLCVALAICGLFLLFKKPKPRTRSEDDRDYLDPLGPLPTAPPPRRKTPEAGKPVSPSSR